MSHRVNVMLDDEVWASLQEIPQGDRSRLINQAVSETLLKRKREEAFARIEAARMTMKPVPGTSEQWVREDRDSH
ncbi:hypothetical protein [Methylococcus sp. Mc7]|uniref:hypothetical protein n=1 Tax=Methylococcus sp. Mc7 TaxID=2860258 RepID=UPI001C5299DA|nr:hypothetical protein [Methylococcus sp. Mc7]QXP84559.1 hypothetical protein KW115_01995 [Methylococcus sp. Mc7]